MNRVLSVIVVATLGLAVAMPLAGCEKKGAATEEASADARCPHELKTAQCPFCNPDMIERDGFCGDHAVAEALCATCRPYLKAAFRAKGDWCEEHKLPGTQCIACNPELADKVRPGEHGGPLPDDHDHDDHDNHDH